MSEVQQFRFRLLHLLLSVPILLLGCGKGDQTAQDAQTAPESTTTATLDSQLAETNTQSDIPMSEYKFEPAVMLIAGGEKISVESPGFACPTFFDFDDDGVEDLIVGQFNSGKMKWFRNTAAADEVPEFAAGEWISCGDEPAEVPGVS